jgi:hypothetical protein
MISDNNYSQEMEQESLKAYRQDILGVEGAFHIHNLLTPEECQRYIQTTENMGYTDETHPNYQSSKIDFLEKKNRSNMRLVWEAPTQEADFLFQRCKHLLSDTIYEGKWSLLGIKYGIL